MTPWQSLNRLIFNSVMTGASRQSWHCADLPDTCLMRWRRWTQQAAASVLRRKLSRARSALLRARYAPDHIANIVRHQNGAVRTECYSYRSSIGHPLVRCEEPGQNIPRRPGRVPVLERHEDDLVATQRAAVLGAVLPDGYAVGKARKRAGRQPA